MNETYDDAFETRYLAPLHPCAMLALAYHIALFARIFTHDARARVGHFRRPADAS